MKNGHETSKPLLSHASFVRRLLAGAILLNLLVIAITGLSLYLSRIQYEEKAAVETRNLAQVLEQHIDGTIDKVNMALFAMSEEFEHQFARGGINRPELDNFLARMITQTPELDRLMVFDPRGNIIFHTGSNTGALKNVADREYFLHLRKNPVSGLYISKPIKSRVSGKWVVVLARRINMPDGSFAGTICGSLSLDHFLNLFASIDVGRNGAIALRDGELGVIARFPEPSGAGSAVGQKKVSREMTKLVRTGKPSGTFKTIAPIDGVERIYSYRRFSDYPFHIVVGLSSKDYLREWHSEIVKMSAAAAFFLLATLFSSLMIYIGWKSRNIAVRSLEEQEKKFRTVADYTYDWEYWIGPDETFLYITPSCKKITGYDAELFYDDPDLFNRLIHPDDRELYVAHRCEKSGGTSNMAFRIIRADGVVRWLEHTCQPILDDSDGFLGNRCCNRDITERKLAEQVLREIQFSVDHAALPIFWIREGGRFFYVNEACGYLGYSEEELLKMSVYDIDPDFSREEATEILKAVKEKGSMTFERLHRTRDGRLIPVEVTLNDLEHAGETFHVAYVMDRSERKSAEARIAHVENRFRAIFESAHDGIFLIAPDSIYADCNPAASEMFRCAKKDMLTKNPQWFSPPFQPDGRNTGEKAEELIAAALEGKPQSFEWKHRRADGSEFDAMVMLSRFELDQEPMMLAIVRDISQRKSLETQLYHSQKLEAVGRLAGGVAHDFNNLLTAITGYGSMMKMKMKPDDPQMVTIEQILSAADRAAQLTRGLLAFSRKQIINPKPVELNAIVKGIDKLLRRLIGEDIILTSKLAEKLLKVMADAGQIEQVLMNLVTNARDAMPDGGAVVITTEEKRERHFCFPGLIKPGNYALITVSDTGEGMDEKTREKIFEPFFTTKELGRGTGLGLAIVYGIIKQHNGFIDVNSEPGKGTTFRILLPLISETIADMDAKTLPPPEKGTETILLAEDDQVVRTMVGIFLRDFGYRVIDAVDGEEALEKFAEHEKEIDLLILDVILPKKSGGEVYNAVRGARPELDILFVSGYTADIIHKKGIYDEDLQFISKPINPFDLLRKIREILDGKL